MCSIVEQGWVGLTVDALRWLMACCPLLTAANTIPCQLCWLLLIRDCCTVQVSGSRFCMFQLSDSLSLALVVIASLRRCPLGEVSHIWAV